MTARRVKMASAWSACAVLGALSVGFVAPTSPKARGLQAPRLRGAGPFAEPAHKERTPSLSLLVPGVALLGLGALGAGALRSRPARRAEPSEKPGVPPVRMPMISTGTGAIDVMSKLLQDRILMLNGQVNDEMANVLVAQILYLANQDAEKDITIYINSPGGSVSAGMAIFDAMQFVPCNVSTVCYGMAASMGAFLLGAGTKGKRRSLPNARIMIHQPLGGAGGQAADIEIQAKEILFLREILNTYLADFTGKSLDVIAEDCDRDYYMTPEEASKYGIIDEVIETKSWPRLKKPSKPELVTGGKKS